ncbi:methionyl-tRNA formyltransferase [bacterium]|nr:MAG: methionyl-tRNA formyltransferase [bacterium]
MRLVFMGSPELAVPSLEAVYHSGQLVGVVTQPARKKGRGLQIEPSPVAIHAAGMGIDPSTPTSVRTEEFTLYLRDLKPDLIVVVAYGKILPAEILQIPRLGCINVHASLLPELRGAAPIQWAIARGYEVTGATIMLMDEGMDTGPIYLQQEVEIKPKENSRQLGRRLSLEGARLLTEIIPKLDKGTIEPRPQDDARATYAPLLTKDDGKIAWTMDSLEIANRIRGFITWPGSFTYWCGKRLLITAARSFEENHGQAPGTVLRADKDQFTVACGSGALRVTRLQPEGKNEMNAANFISGYRVSPGDYLEDKENS